MKNQYNFVKEARHVLLSYCSNLSEDDFIQENSAFGRGSIRNLLVHIANTYEHWIGKQGLKKELRYTPYDAIQKMDELIELFRRVDSLMGEFFDHFEQKDMDEITYMRDGNSETVTPLKLFTHVITHEFHHKGQVLSLSRHLGYVPADTDIIR